MDISVLIPIRDEELNLPEFHQIAANSLSTNKSVIGRLEFIYINDCSEDKSLEVLHDLAKTDTRIKIIDFSKQFLPLVDCSTSFSKSSICPNFDSKFSLIVL